MLFPECLVSVTYKVKHGMVPHIKWVPCHHGMVHPQVVDGGESLQIRSIGVNILNKKLQTADKEWSSSLGVGQGANNSPS
jgi:hypothetical protein